MAYFLLKYVAVMSQLVYWQLLRDETREDAVWDACVSPGEEWQGNLK